MTKSDKVRDVRVGSTTVERFGVIVRWNGDGIQLPFRAMASYGLRRRWLVGKLYLRITMDKRVYRVHGSPVSLQRLLRRIEDGERIYNSH